MRDGSGRIGTLMLGSAIALALGASPVAIDWTGLDIDLKSAEAKGDGGEGGGGKGGKSDNGGKGGKNHGKGAGGEGGGSEGGEGDGEGGDSEGGEGDGEGGGSEGGEGDGEGGGSEGGEGDGEGGGSEGGEGDSEGGGSEGGEGDGEGGGSVGKEGKAGEGGSEGDSDNDGDGDDGEGSEEGNSGKGRGGWKGSDAGAGESEADDGDSDDDDSGDGDDGDSDDGGGGEESGGTEGGDSTADAGAVDGSSASADQGRSRRAAAPASAGSLFATPVIARNAAHRPAAARRTVSVSIKTVRGLPTPDRDGFERAGVRIAAAPAPAPAASADPAVAIAPCATDAPCPPTAGEALAPMADIAPPAIESAAGPVSLPDPPRDPVPDPTQTQLAYAIPKTGLEPEPRPDIDENIYGLMQVEAVRYVDTTIPILVVQGLVFNMSRARRPVPPLVAIVSDADGRELARWKFTAEAPTLAPGASTGFRSETVDPAPDSTRVTVVFAEHDQPQVAGGEAPIEPR